MNNTSYETCIRALCLQNERLSRQFRRIIKEGNIKDSKKPLLLTAEQMRNLEDIFHLTMEYEQTMSAETE